MSSEPEPNYIEIAVDIVAAFVSNNSLPATELPALINSVHAALQNVGKPVVKGEEPKRVPAVPVKKSITPDHLISLEDGKPYKSLKRHLNRLGLTPEAYREKWGLPSDYPMVSPNYAKTRSELAKSMGLGQQRSKGAPTDAAANDTVKGEPTSPPAKRGRKKAA